MENLGDILKRVGTTRNISGSEVFSEKGDASSEGSGSEACGLCGGRGWFTPDVPVERREFGQVITCQCQEDKLKEGQSARLLRYSNLGHLSRLTFEELDRNGASSDPESRRLFANAHKVAMDYAEKPSGWLVFTGPNGSGKTHLAAAIANHCINKGHVVFFVYVPDLLDHLRATFAPTSDASYSDLFEQVKNTPLLVMDGLGSHGATTWAQEKLQQIINHRYNAELPTIVTTVSEMSELDGYMRSRFEAQGLSRIVQVQSREPGPVHHLGLIEPEMLNRMTFDSFDVRGNKPRASQKASLEGALQAAKNFASDPDGWITLFGNSGVGKTHLSIAIAGERLKKGNLCFFAFVPDLLDYIRHTFAPGSSLSYDRLFYEVRSAPLLILDDLGLENASPWTYEKLYQIIVHRHNARLPTVITSTEDFTKAAGPIGSRIRDPYVGQLVRVDAPDYRINDRTKHRQKLKDGVRRGQVRR